jgi:type IV fimbrial biogenesis protein FimT
MTQPIDAREFTVTIGLSNGHEYVYVTHRNSGKQWMSKSRVESKYDLSWIARNIDLGATNFYPDRPVGSCDHRFWMPVKEPVRTNKQSGYTLIELLITTTLVAILAMVGIPSMSDLIKNDRLSTQINTLVGHLALARSSAVTLQQPVKICASSGLESCDSTDWATGWIVYVDADRSGDVSDGDDVLRVRQPLPDDSTLTNSTANPVVTYDDRGFAFLSAGSFSLCDNRGAEYVKSITLSVTGRVRRGGSSSCT